MKIAEFLGGTDEQYSKDLSYNKLVNLYPVTNNDGSVTALRKVEGLKLEGALQGVPQGTYKTTTNRAFYVYNGTLYELSSALVSTSRGSVSYGEYSFSDNGIELILVNGVTGYIFTLATNTLTEIKVITGNFTVSVASPAVFTKTAHGLVAGDRIILSTTGVLPTGLLTNTVYYVISAGLTANNFEVSETSGGSAVNTENDTYPTSINSFTAMTSNKGLFVAVGNSSVFPDQQVMTSTDGVTWEQQTSANALSLTCITWGNNLYVACADNGTASQQVITSPDGITWTARTSASERQWKGVAFGYGVFCAVAYDGLTINQVMTSADGITWTSQTSASLRQWKAIARGAGVFCAVAYDGVAANQVMTSPDGVTWTSRTASATSTWVDIAWNGTVFCAVSDNGTLGAVNVMTSPDGITWTTRKTDTRLSKVIWNDTVFIATGGIFNTIYTSPDGITWTQQTSPGAITLLGWNGSVVSGIQGSRHTSEALISTDNAVTWSRQSGTHTLTTIGYGFPAGTRTVSYMNGRFICCEPNTQNFYVSEVLDGGYWDALNVQTVDSNPDYVTCQVVSQNECIVFCEYSGEVFYDSGALPSPFIRNQSGIFEVGCNAPFSIAILDNSIFWLGQNQQGSGIVYRLNGYTPVRISTYSIEQSIKGMTDITDARGFSYQFEGHHFYVLTFPTGGKTFVFDANTNLWHERANFSDGTFSKWEARDFLYFNGVQYVTSYNSANIYSLDSATFKNGTEDIKFVRSFRTPTVNMERIPHGRLILDAEVGAADLGDTEPQVMLRWSDDMGNTWSNLKTRGLGEVGEYSKRVRFNRLGATKGRPRIYELSGTSDAKIVLLNVYIE